MNSITYKLPTHQSLPIWGDLEGYFGARYYDSDLSIWLSVDPMADKYPYQSPYVYCGNNPLNIIDPDGMDEWDLNKKTGEVTWKNDNGGNDNHSLHALDKNGNRTGKSVTVKDRAILDGLTQSRSDYDGHYGEGSKSDVFRVFKFGADNSDAEWTAAGFKSGEGRSYAVGTSNKEASVSSLNNIDKFDKFNMIFQIHSHPGADGTQGASNIGQARDDMGQIRKLGWQYHNAEKSTGKGFPRHYIYHPHSKKMFNYNFNKSNIFIRNIKTSGDLYRNLSF